MRPAALSLKLSPGAAGCTIWSAVAAPVQASALQQWSGKTLCSRDDWQLSVVWVCHGWLFG